MLFWTLGTLTYLVFGYWLGTVTNKEYANNIATAELGIFSKLRRLFLFPSCYHDWRHRQISHRNTGFPFDSLRGLCGNHYFGEGRYSATDQTLDKLYCKWTAFVWPLRIIPFAIALATIVCFICKKVALMIGSGIGLLMEIPFNLIPRLNRVVRTRYWFTQKLKVRDTFKKLLIGTWGQSTLGAPLWIYLFGWKLAALNIILSWLAWKFGRQKLIDEFNSMYTSKSPQEAIDSIRLFKEDELSKHIKTLNKALEELREKLANISRKISRTSVPVDPDPLRTGFQLALERLNKISTKTQEKINQLEEILQKLTGDQRKLDNSLELLELHRFIETVSPQELGDSAGQIIADTYKLMDGYRQMIELAGKSEVRALSADSEIPIDRIAERLEAPDPAPVPRQKALA